jgi:hypothetical protein
MLQRVQTLFMIGAVLLNGYVFVGSLSKYNSQEEFIWLAMTILSLLASFITIFSIANFKKRQLQFVLNRLSIIFNFILLSLFIFHSLKLSGDVASSMKGIEVFLILISIVLLVLANKFIKKDEDLVKSVDRIR